MDQSKVFFTSFGYQPTHSFNERVAGPMPSPGDKEKNKVQPLSSWSSQLNGEVRYMQISLHTIGEPDTQNVHKGV